MLQVGAGRRKCKEAPEIHILSTVTYADNDRHYGFYIDRDIAKLPGGGREGAAVLCELVPDQLMEDPNPHTPKATIRG